MERLRLPISGTSTLISHGMSIASSLVEGARVCGAAHRIVLVIAALKTGMASYDVGVLVQCPADANRFAARAESLVGADVSIDYLGVVAGGSNGRRFHQALELLSRRGCVRLTRGRAELTRLGAELALFKVAP